MLDPAVNGAMFSCLILRLRSNKRVDCHEKVVAHIGKSARVTSRQLNKHDAFTLALIPGFAGLHMNEEKTGR